jgi:lipopolysaccharide transport system ATP-binding protein
MTADAMVKADDELEKPENRASSDTVILSMTGIGKDFPQLNTAGNRINVLLSLLRGTAPSRSFTALQNITLEVKRGESLGVIGDNGAGKSTLLKVAAKVVKPTAGTMHVNGKTAALLELGTGFHPDYTGRENIYLAAALAGLSKAEIDKNLQQIIDFADIGTHIDQPVNHYSTGMTVRLGFAVATALSPELLITDEVLAVGDESFQKKCMRWIEQYLNAGGTLMLCSHSMYHIQTLCPKTVWIHEGKIYMYGDSFRVTQAYLAHHEEKNNKLEKITRGTNGPNALRMISHWITNAQGEIPANNEVALGESLRLYGTCYAPPDESPVILIGIARADGSPLYGTHSTDHNYTPTPIGDNRYAFHVHFPNLSLLPGKYRYRAHVLDKQGLRLFDSLELDFWVTGRTRDYGLCRLEHQWLNAPLASLPAHIGNSTN